MHPVAHSGH